jgi:hypothetical protein
MRAGRRVKVNWLLLLERVHVVTVEVRLLGVAARNRVLFYPYKIRLASEKEEDKCPLEIRFLEEISLERPRPLLFMPLAEHR